MTNRIPPEDQKSTREEAMNGMTNFFRNNHAEALFQVFRDLLYNSGWTNIDRNPAADLMARTVFFTGWITAHRTKTPAQVIKESDGDAVKVIVQLLETIVHEALDRYLKMVPATLETFKEIWPDEDAFREMWSSALSEARRGIAVAKLMEETAHKIPEAKDADERLDLRLSVFDCWKKLRASTPGEFTTFGYIGSYDSLREGVRAAADDAADQIQAKKDTTPRLYIFGELSESGTELLDRTVERVRNNQPVDESKIQYRDKPITVFEMLLIAPVNTLMFQAQSGQILHSAAFLAAGQCFKEIQAIGNSTIAVLSNVQVKGDEGNLHELAGKAMQSGDAEKLMEVFIVHYWFNQGYGPGPERQTAAMRAVETEDGYAFEELTESTLKPMLFAGHDVVDKTAWDYFNELNQGNPEAIARAKNQGVIDPELGVVVRVGIPLGKPEIF